MATTIEKTEKQNPATIDITLLVPEESPSIELKDVDNPKNWSAQRKSAIACFVLFSTFVANSGVPLYLASLPQIQQKFNISQTLAIAPLTIYAFSLGVGALFATAACEIYGRRVVNQIAISMALIFTIVGATATSFTVILVARTMVGLAVGPCTTVGAPVLNDLWDMRLEKVGMTWIVLSALLIIWSSQSGPMISASLMTYGGWQWTFWASVILLIIAFFGGIFLPETYHPKLKRLIPNNETLPTHPTITSSNLKPFLSAVARPIHTILVEPIVFHTGLVMSILQAVVYAYYVAYAMLFEKTYHFTRYEVGMTFAPMLVGSVMALGGMFVFDKLVYRKAKEEAARLENDVELEMRFYPAMVGSVTLPLSLFWLAWTGRPSIHWIVPAMSGVLFGMSYVLIMLSLPAYNNDVYTSHYGASVLAATTFMRFAISCAFPLLTAQMVDSLGFAWAVSVLGFLTVVVMPIPWVFWKWGPWLRSRTVYLQG